MKSLIFLLLFLFPLVSDGQIVKFRDYKKGETFKYRLTTEVHRNEKFASKTVAISKHEVVKNTNYLSDQVSWLHKTSYTLKDTVNLDSVAQKVKPYRISLSPKGKVLLPKLDVAGMTGEITDLNTFYVALAPALNAQKLSSNTPEVINDELRKGNFADSIEVLYGTDCLQIKQKLIKTDKKFSTVETIFAPPSSLCLTPLIDTIGKKTFDQFNNIQFIRKSEGNKVNLFWGVETFTITSKIDNKNGQIVEASMTNILNLKMRYNATQDLKEYAVELPITIKRTLKLELLK